jgi:hypothetical protein
MGDSFRRKGKQKMRGLSLVLTAAMVGGMVPGAMFGQTAASAPDQAAQTTTKSAKKAAATMPMDAEVADAKA